MRKVLLLSLIVGSSALAQAGANPEIYLLPLSVHGASITVGQAVNVTNRAGYDNQPSFTSDGRALYYTSTRADEQADIYRYDIGAGTTARVTRTAPESEYSATQVPRLKSFSVIRVEKDSAQRLWMLPPDGNDGRPVFAGIKPVGYHTWIDENRLALFVLGSPNALVLADRRTGRGDTLARDIGRSLVTLPNGGGFSFLAHRGREWVLTVVRLTRAGRVVYINPLATMPPGMDYIAWVGGTAIGGTGSKLMAWTPGGTWREVADLGDQQLSRISRIAVSPDWKRIALVAEPSR
jgi:dipeptidyl aminopeptidase/acylaminoacyl peptidase